MRRTTCGTPPAIELHLRHMPGGKFTDHVFGTMKEKEILRIEGPFGSFFLREDSHKPIVLLASGTGFAPIKAIIEHMQPKAHRPARRCCTGAAAARRPVPARLGATQRPRQLPNLRYVPVLSEPKPDDGWPGRTGFVHRAVMDDLPDLSGHQVYACGAPVMVESAQARLRRRMRACRPTSSTPTPSPPRPTNMATPSVAMCAALVT